MTESTTALLSVRGDASLEVEPDCAVIDCRIRTIERDKQSALAGAARHLDTVRAELERLGGAARTSGTQRMPLSWLARSFATHDEYSENGKRPTGRIIAAVTLTIEVRDFALIERVSSALAADPATQINAVNWTADNDNAGWRQVRTAAITAAIQQGRDYAAALGGALLRIEQVADAGLLDGGRPEHFYRAAAVAASWHEDESPSLDPQPIELNASIDVRLIASVAPLT